ncbi:putative methyltransferase type 11 [Rosellinia necatrix]|uniref:Putative methyltransferase type 11 n=1 Tax=Rosellinia necatrix TaxID=77044 RepID=A0A1S7UIL8_ROSNE|nr:putative methyltransferase type 11 [Rosellinia necatrix]
MTLARLHLEVHVVKEERMKKTVNVSLSTNLIKTRSSLSLLETPIEIDNFQDQVSAELPEDIQILHRQVYLAGRFLQNIIPYEVRDEVMAAVGDIYPPSCFRQPDQAHQTPGAVAKTKATHAALRKIMKAAARSTSHGRHEGAWNMCVHWPILDLVFEEEEHVQEITTRAEAIASATIEGHSIPEWHDDADSAHELACTVSVSSSSAGTTNTTGIADKTEKSVRIHSRGDSEKVDFVLVMDLPSTLPLKQSIRTLITAVNRLRTNPPPPQVNQTTYAPILESPIAVSIQTKTAASAEDALLQLGIWHAAWHKRLHYLRGHLAEMSP